MQSIEVPLPLVLPLLVLSYLEAYVTKTVVASWGPTWSLLNKIWAFDAIYSEQEMPLMGNEHEARGTKKKA